MASKKAPFIAPQLKETPVDLSFKLDKKLLAELDQYCIDISSDRDYVLSQMVRVIIDHDRAATPKKPRAKAPLPIRESAPKGKTA